MLEMRFAVLVAACLASASWLTQPALAAADSLPTADKIARLIADLGSEEYTVRESASEELTRIGLPAFSALESAANHPDREVRYRSQRVLGIIRRHDIERRLEAFLSGKEDSEDYPLPGWSRFSKAYGDGPEQRKLFVEMTRADAELMRAIEENPRRAAETLVVRVHQAQQAMQFSNQTASLGQVAASLFVAADPDVTVPTITMSALFRECFQPGVREAIDRGSRREVPRKMLGAIIGRSDDSVAFEAMGVASQFKLREGIVPATRILKNYDVRNGPALAHRALITIADLGDASHLPLVDNERLMHDATQVSQLRENGNETTYTIQLRDIALAAAILLSKQDLKSFFEIPSNQSFSDPQLIFLNARLIGFSSDAKRTEVFAKWEKYKAEQDSKQEVARRP
jgi:hypothetical protein